MDDHVKMIRARRVAEHRPRSRTSRESGDAAANNSARHGRACTATRFDGAREPEPGATRRPACPSQSMLKIKRRKTMAKDKFIIEPHFRLQEWVAEEKGYFKDEGLDYVFRELVQSTGRRAPRQGRQGRRHAVVRGAAGQANVSCACHWTVGVAASKGKGKLYGEVYSVSPSAIFVPAEFTDQEAGGSRRRADLGRLPVRQPLRHHPGARAVTCRRQDQPVVRRRHAVQAAGQSARRQVAGLARCSAGRTTSPSSSASARSSTTPS